MHLAIAAARQKFGSRQYNILRKICYLGLITFGLTSAQGTMGIPNLQSLWSACTSVQADHEALLVASYRFFKITDGAQKQ